MIPQDKGAPQVKGAASERLPSQGVSRATGALVGESIGSKHEPGSLSKERRVEKK